MTNILDLLEGKYGIYRTTNNPNEFRFNCPECGDNKYHLYINTTLSVGYCHKCANKLHLSQIFGNILNYKPRLRRKKTIRDTVIDTSDYTPILGSTEEIAELATQYMSNRGIFDMTNIWYGTSMKWFGRVVFPVIEHGSIVYAVGRSMLDDEPKYLNTVGDKPYIYRLNEMKSSPYIVITEGCIDALSAPNTVALMGKTITQGQMAKLRVNIPSNRPIYIALDGDAINYAAKLADELQLYYHKVYVILFSNGEDLNSISGRWKDYPIIEATKDILFELIS